MEKPVPGGEIRPPELVPRDVLRWEKAVSQPSCKEVAGMEMQGDRWDQQLCPGPSL